MRFHNAIDLVQVLTWQFNDLTARNYWGQLKRPFNKEGGELVTSCHQLKMIAVEGWHRHHRDGFPSGIPSFIR